MSAKRLLNSRHASLYWLFFLSLLLTTAASAQTGQILYTDASDGSLDIWRLDLSDGGLTNLSVIDFDPLGEYSEGFSRFSPDGSQILFTSRRDGSANAVWVMNSDGTNAQKLRTANEDEINPFWGPDGESIYYSKNTQFAIPPSGSCAPCPYWEIYRYDVGSGTETQITFNQSRDEHPVPSPDGALVAISRAENPLDCCNPRDVWIMEPDGSNAVALSPRNGRYETPRDWDPVTDRILVTWPFDCSSSSCNEVALVDRSGNVDRITDNSIDEIAIAVSPDGQFVLGSVGGNLHLVDIATGALSELLDLAGTQFGQDWQANPNQPPNAICQDAAVVAGPFCSYNLTPSEVDGGSFDAEDDPFTLSVDPMKLLATGSYAAGLTASDDLGRSTMCQAQVEMVDDDGPMIASNSPRRVRKRALPVSFQATANDNCSAVTPEILSYQCRKKRRSGHGFRPAWCEIEISGDTLTILATEGPETIVRWELEAFDDSGNRSTETARVRVVRLHSQH